MLYIILCIAFCVCFDPSFKCKSTLCELTDQIFEEIKEWHNQRIKEGYCLKKRHIKQKLDESTENIVNKDLVNIETMKNLVNNRLNMLIMPIGSFSVCFRIMGM